MRLFAGWMQALLQVGLGMAPATSIAAQEARPRAREIGIAPGIFKPGTNNAITDVGGVLVGQTTVIQGDSIRTGVTVIRPHPGNVFLDRVPAATLVGNGFGKLLGTLQVAELGELETPIILTCTLCVWKAADAMVGWMLEQPGMESVRSINPVVGETNDGGLNTIEHRPITAEQVRSAIESARSGAVEEGAVGAGTGTIAFGWKGGIGTSSRRLPAALGGWTVGVLVQTNYGGVLQILGVPVGRELGNYAFKDQVEKDPGKGSIMMVVATDAPLDDRNLRRLANRALLGLARTGSPMANGSGDFVIAFSTHPSVRRSPTPPTDTIGPSRRTVHNQEMTSLFEGALEATEEAIYNSMLKATTTKGRMGTVEALPVDRVKALLAKYRASER